MVVSCSKCHRPLKNPLSIELKMGPVCRLTNKIKSMNKESLFAPRSSFIWGFLKPTNPKFIKPIIWIEDNDNGKSVTNDIDNVLRDINQELTMLISTDEDSILNYLIMYRDTAGVWDGITASEAGVGRDGAFFNASFFSIHKRDRQEAAEKLWDTRGRAVKEKKEGEENVEATEEETLLEE